MADEYLHLLLTEVLEDAESRAFRVYDRRRNSFEELLEHKFVQLFRLSKELVRFLSVIRPFLTQAYRDQDIDIETKVIYRK